MMVLLSRSALLITLTALLGLGLGACSREPETGPVEVRWDKVVCARCIMAVSDHHFSAQVRGGSADRRTKVYLFDDLGCAVLWLDEQKWKDDPRTEMWVTDYKTGAWLNAFRSFYVKGNITPMDFGLGAVPDSIAGALDYDQAVKEIYYREETYH